MNNVIQFKKKEDDRYKTNIYYRFGQAKALLNFMLGSDSLTSIERTSIDKFFNKEKEISNDTTTE